MSIPFDIQNLHIDYDDLSRESLFLRTLSGSYRVIYVYVLSIVGNHHDADDVIQDVCAVLWEKFDSYDPDRSFQKWAFGIAFNLAKSFMRRRRRKQGFCFSEETLAKIVFVQSAGNELFELRRERLDACLAKLRPKDRKFLMDCYSPQRSQVELAQSLQVPVRTVYTRIRRIREYLVQCVNRNLGKEVN